MRTSSTPDCMFMKLTLSSAWMRARTGHLKLPSGLASSMKKASALSMPPRTLCLVVLDDACVESSSAVSWGCCWTRVTAMTCYEYEVCRWLGCVTVDGQPCSTRRPARALLLYAVKQSQGVPTGWALEEARRRTISNAMRWHNIQSHATDVDGRVLEQVLVCSHRRLLTFVTNYMSCSMCVRN